MVAETTFAKPDYFPHLQHSTRGLPTPKFGRPTEVRGAQRPVRSIAWSCDGRKVAVGTEMKGLRVYDVRSSGVEGSGSSIPSGSRSSPHNGHITAIAFSPVQPRVLLTGDKLNSGGSSVAVWDLNHSSSPVAVFKISGDILHVAWHPSGDQFAVVCPRSNFDEVLFYRREKDDGKDVWEKREDVGLGMSQGGGYEEINSLRFTNSGKLVCGVSNDGSISAWLYPLQPRVEPPAEAAEPKTATDEPIAAEEEVEESTDKSRVPTPREGSPVYEPQEQEATDGAAPATEDVEMAETPATPPAESVSTPTVVRTVPPSRQPTPPPTAPAPSTEADRRKAIQLHRFRHAVVHCGSLLALAFDPTGRYLAVGGQDALLSLFDTRDWICVRTYDVCTMAIRQAAFSHDGELLAVGGDDSYIAVVAVYSGSVIARLPVNGVVQTLAWHPTRNMLAWSTSAKTSSAAWYYAQQE